MIVNIAWASAGVTRAAGGLRADESRRPKMSPRTNNRVTPDVLGASAERRVRQVLRAARDTSEDALFRQEIDEVLRGMLTLETLAGRQPRRIPV